MLCLYLWVVWAENTGSSSDEISNQQGEPRQAEEEESRWAGANDSVQNILINMNIDT